MMASWGLAETTRQPAGEVAGTRRTSYAFAQGRQRGIDASMGQALTRVKPGMIVTRRSDIITTDREDKNGKRVKQTMMGTVIYVHPEGRFHTVEFEMRSGRTVRESFCGVMQ